MTTSQSCKYGGRASIERTILVFEAHWTCLFAIMIRYQVHRMRDAKNFVTRSVTGIQRGRAIFTVAINFHRAEPGLTHQEQMPPAPDPESLPTLNQLYEKHSQDPRVPDKIRKSLKDRAETPFPMDLRNTEDWMAVEKKPKHEARQLVWMRSAGRLDSDDFLSHACALAYLSDWSLLRTSLLPHGLTPFEPRLQTASLDHSMWFHAPFRADEWLLYEMTSPRAGGGRGLNFGHIFSRDGTLVVTVAQEGLIRLGATPPAKPVGAWSHTSKSDAKDSDAAAKAARADGNRKSKL